MDILGKVKSAVGVTEVEQQNDLFSAVVHHIKNMDGGLNGLVQQFRSQGLGSIVTSWIGTGENIPITTRQVQDVMGTDTLKEFATKLGTDTDDVTMQLTTLLPKVVDKLTPDGKVPEGDLLHKGIEKLGELFGKK